MMKKTAADSASLWNYTLSPGWSQEECEVLRQALMKFGIGNWMKISESGCLPGKTIAQMNLQTQRLLGQQSTVEFRGLHIDPLEIGKDNAVKKDATRKNGCIVNTGNKLTPEEVKQKIESNRFKYEKPPSIYQCIKLPKSDLALLKEKRAELEILLAELLTIQENIQALTENKENQDVLMDCIITKVEQDEVVEVDEGVSKYQRKKRRTAQ